MAKTVLSLRELNRTLLARQLLLDRAPINALDAVRRVVALQSQIPNPPYIGLWTRLTHFQRADLTRLLEERHVVRAAFLRSTLHVVAAADHHHFRPVIAPAFLKALKGFFGKRTAGIDSDHVVAVARPFLLEQPRTMGEIEAFLLTHYPDADSAALGYTLRTHLPLVQIPPAGTWGAGTKAAYTTADHWLGADTPPADIKTLFARYLRAFGPASIMDFQTWTGMTNLKQALEPHLAEFVMYQDEQGRVLFDVPDQPIDAKQKPPLGLPNKSMMPRLKKRLKKWQIPNLKLQKPRGSNLKKAARSAEI